MKEGRERMKTEKVSRPTVNTVPLVLDEEDFKVKAQIHAFDILTSR